MRRLAALLALPALLVLAGCCCENRCRPSCDPCAKPAAAPAAAPARAAPAAPKAPKSGGVAEAPAGAKPINETCPVLLGNPITPGITTVWQGKLIGFCCPMCKAKFEKNPEKYSKNLP